MTDEIEWPLKIWMAEREEHDQGVVSAVLSEHATIALFEGDTDRERKFRRYVDGDIYDNAEKYWRARLDQKIDALDVKPLAWDDFEDEGDVRGAKAKAFYDASYLIAKRSTGKYEVSVSYPGYQAIFNGPQFYDSVDDAKAAAQADYERRIRAVLKGGAE